jgi:nucleotide-binding universal stress UspA family protein
MQPFQSILFAGDFSENSVQAFHVACLLSHEGQTHLTVLHVAPPDRVAGHLTITGRPVAGSPQTPTVEDPRLGLKHESRDVYSPDRPLDVHYRTSIGDDPSKEILHVADEISADLIVMGTHGRTGLRRLMAGSVASSVLARSHCSVLALHGGGVRREDKDDAIRVILHPTDFSAASETALKVARSLARDHGARLIVLHIVPLDVNVDGNISLGWDSSDDQAALEGIRNRLDGSDLKYPVETRLVRGFEAEEIINEARDFAADLIVMGTHGRTGLSRVLMGNTAESVLPKAECPVLIVKSSPGILAPTPELETAGTGTAP